VCVVSPALAIGVCHVGQFDLIIVSKGVERSTLCLLHAGHKSTSKVKKNCIRSL